MNNGDLKWVARVESPATQKTGSGADANPAQRPLVGIRRVKIEEVSGTTADEGVQQRIQTAWYTVTLRYAPEIKPTFFLVIKGRPFDGITMKVNNRRHSPDKMWTQLTCVVKSNQ